MIRAAFSPLAWVAGLAALVIGLLTLEVCRKSVVIDMAHDRMAEAEGDLVRTSDALVAERASQKALLDEADRLQVQLADLSRQLGQKPRVVEVVKWRTRELEVPVPGPPREVTCPHGEVVPCPDCPPVRLSVSGVEARVETKAGNLVALGSVRVKRLAPLPEETWDLPWEGGKLTAPPAPDTRVRWMLGPRVEITSAGLQYGAAAVTPAMRLGHLQVRIGLDATTDFAGGNAAGISALIGWGRPR